MKYLKIIKKLKLCNEEYNAKLENKNIEIRKND